MNAHNFQEAVKPFDVIIPIYVNDDGDWCELPSVNQVPRNAELATKEFYDRCLSDYLTLADTPDWDFFESLVVGETYRLFEGEFVFSESYALIERKNYSLE